MIRTALRPRLSKCWERESNQKMLRVRKLTLALMLAVALPAVASDLAVLRNGFSITCQRREEIGSITRLYVKTGSSGYLDVPTAMIDHFAPDPAPPTASVVPAAQASPAVQAPTPAWICWSQAREPATILIPT